MGSARRITVGLAALLLLAGSSVASARQADAGLDRQLKGTNGKMDARDRARAASQAKVAPPTIAAVPDRAEKPAAPSGGGPSAPEPPAAPAPQPGPSAAPPAAPSVPSGLSKDAPTTAPAVGVIGGGAPGASRSPAATPEPSTLLLMGAGLAGLYRLRRKR